MTRSFRLMLSVTSGVLLSLPWLGFPGWMLFFALFPLLLLDHYFVYDSKYSRSVVFWGYAFLTFIIWNSITTWWIAYATVVGALLAILANSFLMSLVWWLAHAARRHFKTTLGYVALIVFYISFEYFHFHWDVEWPWLTLGNGFANNVKLIQWYEFTGTLGGSLWVLVMNVILFRIYLNFRNSLPWISSLYPGAAFLILLLFPAGLSYSMYNSYTEKENPLNVVIVQPNIDPYSERYDQKAENEKLQIFLRLADSKTNDQTDLVIGPETVFERWPDWNLDRLDYNHIFMQITDWMWNYPNAEVIFGSSTSKIYPDTESASSSARVSNGVHYDVFNTALFIGRSGTEQVYHKSILVSGVEKMPLKEYLWLLNDVVFDLGGTTGSLGRQERPSNFTLKNGVMVAPAICYESVFGGYLTRFVRKGAQLIVVITNDGWWRNTPGYKQHLSFSRLRAIETRRSVARSANTGISCFINQRGDISKDSPWWEEAAIEGTVNLNDKLTFYVNYGDYIARISMFMSVMLLLFMVVKRFIRK
jgi:apolipoprotein N-acyltransferase